MINLFWIVPIAIVIGFLIWVAPFNYVIKPVKHKKTDRYYYRCEEYTKKGSNVNTAYVGYFVYGPRGSSFISGQYELGKGLISTSSEDFEEEKEKRRAIAQRSVDRLNQILIENEVNE